MEAALSLLAPAVARWAFRVGTRLRSTQFFPRDEPCEASNKIVDHLRRQASRIPRSRSVARAALFGSPPRSPDS